uniref:Protein CrcB n=1 Tax=Anthurium amnicola TaxID=1678845 RepID=A0A1D1Z3A7_9ARAE
MAIPSPLPPSPVPKTLIWFLLLAAASLSLLPTARSSSPTLGLDTFLSDQSRSDPQASNDTFLLLPVPLKRSVSSPPAALDPRSLLRYLLSLRLSVPVRVKLVGASFSHAAPNLLHDFVSAALSSGQFQAVGYNPHHLVVSHALHLDASLAAPHLASEVAGAVRSHIGASPAPLHRSALQPVPYSTVDAIVRRDFQKEHADSAPALYIYLLDLGSQSKPYAYTYDAQDASPAYSKCLGSIWTGSERYVWIDLGAGPVDYGPALSGEGVLPRGEFHPLASLHGRPKSEKALLADLASLILSAYHALLVPSLRIPVFYESELLVRFIHVHASDTHDSAGLDWNSIERTIKDGGLLLGGQTLRFETYEVKFSECPICSFAVSRSTNFYTSRFLFDNYTLIVSEYLDSKRLHQVLVDSVAEIQRLAKMTDEEVGRILPVYVFDLDYDKLLLLDRYHQAVAFRDMVIAVRTRSVQTVSDYSCNGRHVITQARSLERPIVGSVLQSMWGISPTHLSWSPQHNNTVVDYTWSVGQTPFGPFSDSLSLSFVQKDAARRNVLLTSLNYTILSAIDVLQSMTAHGGDKKLLQKNRHVEFVQRWNLLNYKLDKTVSAMSHLDFDKALYFLRSSDHDLYAIHTLVYQASQELEASLVCFKDPPFPWATFCVSGMIMLSFFYAYLKRDKLLRSKRKQF